MRYFIIFLMVCVLTACNNADDTTESSVQTGPITFVSIAKDEMGNVGDSSLYNVNLIIDNNTDWVNLINQMDATSSGDITTEFSQTTVDFSQFTVIAVFRELFPHIEFVEITQVMENVNDIEVTTIDSNFNSGFLSTSQPYHIIMIPKTTKPIVFL